jgi:Pyrimidine dimer DNA glycosylase
MRLWSLHPKYLDSKGIVALWRETLLAKAVLSGKTRGYKNHPQLIRFKINKNPKALINTYLLNIYQESITRGYKFNQSKIGPEITHTKIKVTNGQMEYELDHLLKKLKIRDSARYNELLNIKKPEPNPIFIVVDGDIESWEII